MNTPLLIGGVALLLLAIIKGQSIRNLIMGAKLSNAKADKESAVIDTKLEAAQEKENNLEKERQAAKDDAKDQDPGTFWKKRV